MITIIYLACKQALLFGRAKRVSRERARLCPSRLRRSLGRSRETRFARPNRRACSQATIYFVMPAESETVKQGEEPLQELLQKFCVCLIVVGGVDHGCSSITTCCLMSVIINFCNKIIRNGKSDNKSNYCYIYL